MIKRTRVSFVNGSKRQSDVALSRNHSVSLLLSGFLVLLFLSISTRLWADPVPPDPSSTSAIGDFVTNPVTSGVTTVTSLIVDPVGTQTAGATEFVITADGYAFLVKPVGAIIYNTDSPPVAFTILSKDIATGMVTLTADGGVHTATLAYQGTYTNLQAQFGVAPAGPVVTDPDILNGADGIRSVYTGNGGSNGRDGALFVPPTSGGNGATGPTVDYTNTTNILTTDKIGIEVGSIGGKGGKGGDSYASFWSGRDGGDGGAGGTVNVTNSTGIQVATNADDKYGIFAYSRSGAAGNGGSGYGAPGGGTGGHSSDGGSVTVENNGHIITSGNGAFGIYGLSVSNNGGGGGSQWGIVGESGSGGYGGSGGSVNITNGTTGTINTSGNYAHGILAQSIGGSGGSSGTSGNLILSLQGSADNGGNGGTVTVTNNGSIQTTGNYARGIFAESIGGGGGTGGFSGGLLFSLGGSGSNGGSAGTVTVKNNSTGSITTTWIGSDGIFAQSVGGSGGSGSNSFGLVSVGGSGSHAGNGGQVTVENFGTITTGGNSARGIVAQSIGGGGGDGGSTAGMVSVGGSGSGGGIGSTVTVKNGGDIITYGDDATGIIAQSIGGGGGNGGSAGSVSAFAGVAVGGKAGGGGAGGNVNVVLQGKDASNASLIQTHGDRSIGVFAQSVGGGGGNGGGAVQVTGGVFGAASVSVGGEGGNGGAGGTVAMSNGTGGETNIQTEGNDASGVILQSVGGGGGNGGYAVSVAVSGGPVSGSLSVAVGGKGGSGGAGGTVTVGSFDGLTLNSVGFNGNILTTGERSTGFLAQSVGGGGGNGGLSVSAAGGGSLLFSGSIGVGVGGSGGSGGAGGAVKVGIQGDITTNGDASTGLLVQSVGGGGGNGGGSIVGSLSASGGGAGSISVGVGGSAAAGSNGGQATVATRSGTITTRGTNSTGILVQSVGGGGGNGGYSVAVSAAGAGAGAGAVTVGLGGKAGVGGSGGIVTADLQSDVYTFNNNSTGILVQSVGGGGGNGGFNVNAGGSGAGIGSGTVSVGLGGSGAIGGDGGAVTATEAGTIVTKGDYSNAFVAQSIGGGGGNGGFNVDASGSGAGIGSGAVNVGLGGSGGAGGDGGTVNASTSIGPITTEGNYSNGIIAQSIGGGGGNGGFNVSATGSGAGIGSGTVAVGLGGSAGDGGNGGTVSLTVHNNVSTKGTNSAAVTAQSIGGGGGNGGFNVTAAGSGAGIGSGSITVGLGGSGGKGGAGGSVTSTVTGDIETLLENSDGFVAQSIGGGGGNGGFNVDVGGSGAGIGSGSVGVSLGGNGGTGGIGGSVTATLIGKSTTYGDNSAGFIAQSIGGGGGNGGFNVLAIGSGAGIGSGAVSVGLGGDGGTGNNGGIVTANTSSGPINTHGNYSNGILAQSIGGGGGNGGFNVSVAGSGAGTGSGTIAVGLGGKGGAAGNGDTVLLTVQNNVKTEGTNSTAIIAQSIGGGGGNGGFNVTGSGSGAGVGSGAVSVGLGGSGGSGGSGGGVTANVTGNIETLLSNSGGLLAQSIGGGGGNGGFNIDASGSGAGTGSGVVTVGLGGSGGSGGIGGSVTASVAGTISTIGDYSNGFVAQSIGGGGGNGGFNISAGGSGAGTGSGAVSVGLGGNGGTGNNGGAVTATTSTGPVITKGNYSNGILAQSIGGGGGNGGFNVSAAGSGAGTGSGTVTVGLGGSGGAAGNGNTVSLTVQNNVKTEGTNSTAVIAQSIGGGGGNGGFNVSAGGSGAGTYSGAITVGLGGKGGAGGSGGGVTAKVTGNIETMQVNSDGFVAQSIGGGGGNGAFNVDAGGSGAGTGSGTITVGLGGSGGSGGVGGSVAATLLGTIVTHSDYSNGFVAQSIGGGGGNGGFNVSAAGSGAGEYSGAVSVGLGGFGGSGNDAGAVTASKSGGAINTEGNYSVGVLVQSIGGGGGNGGFNVSAAGSGSGTSSGSITVGLGGKGGTAGNGNTVSLTVQNDVSTIGLNSSAVIAQSIGGGGGNGGFNVSASGSGSGEYSGTISAGLGGFGGGGGDAGDVTASVTGNVTTLLDKSSGVIAQSIGGGGGNGGFSVAGALNFTTETGSPASITASVGGFGGSGGAGGDVSLTRIGDTQTKGDDSVGLSAQSIGGGGGNGGLSVAGSIGGPNSKQISASVGGFGGAGSEAGVVTVNNTGNIFTGYSSIQKQQIAELGTVFQDVPVVTGRNSDGILAQSIGGGGGNGGFSFSGTVGPTGENTNLNVGLTVGGFGGDGGKGNDVSVINNGLIHTIGSSANGIEAQSIGGGGGNGGSAVTGLLAAGDSQQGRAVNVAVSVGGKGGDGNTSGKVQVEQTGAIITEGAGSNGILAQSIGGGGGNGGGANSISLQLATSCTFDPLGLVTKVLKITSVQSPKNPSVNVQVDVGGFGGTGGDADTVIVTNHGYISTYGDSSAGIMAQSIGGGGGNGGQAIVGLDGLFPGASYVDTATMLTSLAIGTTGILQGAGRVTVGGFGGASGNGDMVDVTNTGIITTSGWDSYGIFAQSLGGGGGIGGNASSGITGAFSLGGFGGASGNGGTVKIINSSTADITTTGYASSAIVAQSIGGGGGNGGLSAGLISVGGFGSASGHGGAVSVTNEANLKTENDFAKGIVAQSLGGGGGNGGGTGLSGITVGGYGGASGNGGDVNVTNSNTASITTKGDFSDAIFAQSIGGGGGNGGGTGYGLITVGGAGTAGGTGGKVTIINIGNISTSGDDAVGIFAQSIGGGGGNGGATKISAVSVGGKGGSSGNGGEVDITNSSIVSTTGERSDAIRAQSLGGGGGSAGGVSDDSMNGIGLLVSVGGSGGVGGNGGKVIVKNSNKLLTAGNLANGIFAQSVGGGGGYAGNMIGAIAVGGSQGSYGDGGDIQINNDINGTIWTTGIMSNGIFAQSIGGGGGTTDGTITTGNSLAFYTFIGGDGSGGGNGGNVSVDNAGVIFTDGASSQAILAQSIGGGGGNAQIAGIMDNDSSLASAEVRVGGNGGDGGNGGNVTVTNHDTGTIVANGENSTAIFAQSIGGGGGNGGGAIIGQSETSATTTSIIIGGDGGDGGNGGKVNVTNDGIIEINANNSVAIMAQSVGGGGGTAGSAVGSDVIPVSIGGQHGVTGKGGDVTVINSGSIIINGDNSVGIFAQSVGGGGGMIMPGGGASSLSLNDGGIGNGGIVTITNTAESIIVTGANSIALYSQSVGGGGGAVGLESDPPGQIGAFLFSGTSNGEGIASETVINQTGDLIATGSNSIALAAQSDAPDGDGNITINILNSGSTYSIIDGGTEQGAGVFILNGANNQLNNYGVILTGVIPEVGINWKSNPEGFAIRATTGDDHVHNYGWVIGSVDLKSGANSFSNALDALFLSGITVYLGEGNLLSNDGLLLPGGYDRVMTTDLTGNFTQSSTGLFGADLDLRNQITDRLNVSGTGDVSGTIAVNLIDPTIAPGYATPGEHANTLLYTVGNLVYQDISLVAPNTAVATYSLAYIEDPEIDLNYLIDYAPDGLTQNQHSVGTLVNQIQTAQVSPDFRPIATALFFQPDVPVLAKIYDSLSGEGIADFEQSGIYANDLFLKSIAGRIGCWVLNDTVSPCGRSLFEKPVNREKTSSDWKVWMNGYIGSGDGEGDSVVGSANTYYKSRGFAVGIDRQVTPDAVFGFATGYNHSALDVPQRATKGIIDSWHVAGYGAVRNENLYLRGTLAYDHIDNKEFRHAYIPTAYYDAVDGDHYVIDGFDNYISTPFISSLWSGDIELGYNNHFGEFVVTPFAGLKFGAWHMNGFTETDAERNPSRIGLTYQDRTVTSLPARLGVQLTKQTELSANSLLSLSLRTAWVHEFHPDRTLESSFTAAPGFTNIIHGAQQYDDVLETSIGIDLCSNNNVTLFGKFECNILKPTNNYSGIFGLQVLF